MRLKYKNFLETPSFTHAALSFGGLLLTFDIRLGAVIIFSAVFTRSVMMPIIMDEGEESLKVIASPKEYDYAPEMSVLKDLELLQADEKILGIEMGDRDLDRLCRKLTEGDLDLSNSNITTPKDLLILAQDLPYFNPTALLFAAFGSHIDRTDPEIKTLIEKYLCHNDSDFTALDRWVSRRGIMSARHEDAWVLDIGLLSDSPSIKNAMKFIHSLGADSDISYNSIKIIMRENPEVREIYSTLYRDKIAASGSVEATEELEILKAAKALSG